MHCWIIADHAWENRGLVQHLKGEKSSDDDDVPLETAFPEVRGDGSDSDDEQD